MQEKMKQNRQISRLRLNTGFCQTLGLIYQYFHKVVCKCFLIGQTELKAYKSCFNADFLYTRVC